MSTDIMNRNLNKHGKPVIRVVAMTLAIWLSMHSYRAHADDGIYGCTVVLCLGNPESNGGPRAPATCAPAIDRMYDDLRHGRGFPQCSGSGMTTKQVDTPFDPCPAGTTSAGSGALVAQGASTNSRGGVANVDGPGYFTVASDPQVSAAQSDSGSIIGPLACVGTLLGSYQTGNSQDGDVQTISVYDRIIWQQPQSPTAIDVYEAGQFQLRLHY
jgi:hypothetical protein